MTRPQFSCADWSARAVRVSTVSTVLLAPERSLSLFKAIRNNRYLGWVSNRARSAAPLVFGLAGCGLGAHAGPIINALNATGTDVTGGVRILGVALLGWTGVRIWMDEHHSINPGRVAGGVAGGVFAFAPTSLQNWMSGW